MKNKISIITPAYKCAEYVKDYLDSIHNQSFFKLNIIDYEILYCVDNCQETLSEILKHKHHKLRIFNNNGENAYPYVLRNSLLKKAKGNYILFFDADDIAMPNLICKSITSLKDNQIVRFRYYNFKDTINNSTSDNIKKGCQYAHGVFFTKKEFMLNTGGFLPWKCGADSEFLQRVNNNGIKDYLLDEFLFYRRIHGESLTRNPITGLTSEIRNEYKKKYRERVNCELKIKTKTIKIHEIK